MIAYNNGILRTDFKNIYYNNGTLRDVKQVWWNVNGTPKLIWPDGVYTNRRDAFYSGIRRNEYHPGTPRGGGAQGYVGTNDFSFKAVQYYGTDEYDTTVMGHYLPFFITKDKIDMSLYKTLNITCEFNTFPKVNKSGNSGLLTLYFLYWSSDNVQKFVNQPDRYAPSKKVIIDDDWYDDRTAISKTIDVSNITGMQNIGFQMYGRYSGGWKNDAGAEGKITKIQLIR